MSCKKYFVLLLVFTFATIFGFGCSASDSTLRYGSKNESTEDKQNRYDSYNNSAVEDTVDLTDEDVPEYQDPSDLPDDETQIDLNNLLKKLKDESAESNEGTSISTKKELMIMEIIKYMNTPYKYGGNSLNGIDCSAFTQSVYRDALLINLNRSARDQYQQGIPIEDRNDLKFGDLVFFNTRRRVKPGHVGIYIGDKIFVHASSKQGVTTSSLDHEYYSKKYMGARRIEEDK
jgi:cell wall-associated NlpC family hydrolase